MITDYFIEENKIQDFYEKHISPSTRFQLEIYKYQTSTSDSQRRTWEYTRGIISDLSTNEIIFDVKRNYTQLHFSWFTKNNSEWIFCGENYHYPTLYDLHNRKVHKPSTINGVSNTYHEFIWTEVSPNRDSTILAVLGCVWGAQYEVIFYNITDLENWSLLNKPIYLDIFNDMYTTKNCEKQYFWDEFDYFIFYECEEFINIQPKIELSQTLCKNIEDENLENKNSGNENSEILLDKKHYVPVINLEEYDDINSPYHFEKLCNSDNIEVFFTKQIILKINNDKTGMILVSETNLL